MRITQTFCSLLQVAAFTSFLRATSKARKAALFLFSVAVLVAGGTAAVRGQSALDGFDPNANDVIWVVVTQPDGKILLGGDFTTLAPNGGVAVTRNHIARLNPDGTLDAAFNPNANGRIYSIAVQPDGKILAGGFFTSMGGQTRNHIARLDATTGLPDSFDPNSNSGVHSIVLQADGKILMGGTFTSIGGQTRRYIARLDPTTGLPDSFDPNANNFVLTIALQTDGKILAGGTFNGIGGQTRSCIARLEPTIGLADSFNPNADNEVFAIAVQADGKILAGGYFSSIGGQTRRGIARLNPTTGLVDSFDPNATGPVLSIVVQADGKILAGGVFGQPYGVPTIGGQTRNHIARLDPTTGLADSFDPNANFFGFVRSIAVQADGKILAAGEFTSLAPNGGAAVTRNRIARVETDGRLDRTLNPNMVGTVGQFAYVFATALQPDGRILIGGFFDTVLGVARNNIARLNTDGTLDTAFNPNASQNSFVHAIALQTDGKILVSGVFHSIGGQTRNYIARLDPTTGLADSFNPNANEEVDAIAVQADGKILAGGPFTSIGGQTRNHIARLDPTTGLADSFNPNASAYLLSLLVQPDSKILAAGGFTNIGGQTRRYLARLDATTGLPDLFNPDATGAVYAIAMQGDGKILATGEFTNIGLQPRLFFARLDGTTGLADSFNPHPNQPPRSIAVQADGKILAGGVFAQAYGTPTIGGQTRNYIARLDPTTGLADSFDPNASATVFSIAVQADGKILAGGTFTSIGGQRRGFFARLSSDRAALQDLAVTQTDVFWRLGGASPQFTRVTFEYSDDNLNYTPLGNGIPQGGSSNWTLTGLSLPTGQNFYIRARGYYRSGDLNGSESTTESVRNAFLTGLTGTPTPTATATPTATPTATAPPLPTPTPTPDGTPIPTPAPACILSQGFDDITTLPGTGWVETNQSTTAGTTGWFQGNGALFPAQSGAATSYIAADFNNSTNANPMSKPGLAPPLPLQGGTPPLATPTPSEPPWPTPTPPPPPNTISNWLLTPPVTLQNGAMMTFYTRTVDVPQFPDRLQVRMSTNGASTNVGTGPFDVGDFTTLLLEINPNQTTTGYPNVWTQFTLTVSGVASPTTGRVAFRYFVIDGGLHAPNGEYIGIDSVEFFCTKPTPTPTPTSTPTPSPTPARALNISTRLRVETGDKVGIGGFIITGSAPKQVLLRGIGPSLAQFGVPNALADPVMELHGPAGFTTIVNDNWRDTQPALIIATGLAPTNDLESAILVTLDPGNYTAIVKGKNDTSGVGLVEVYDLGPATSQLANISTRAFVGTVDNVVIGGFILGGGGQAHIFIHAGGLSGINPTLADATLELRDGSGAFFASNDDCESSIIGPPNPADACINITLPSGLYTVILAGKDGGTGIGLLEIYNLD